MASGTLVFSVFVGTNSETYLGLIVIAHKSKNRNEKSGKKAKKDKKDKIRKERKRKN
jgi:hypothetical protein